MQTLKKNKIDEQFYICSLFDTSSLVYDGNISFWNSVSSWEVKEV